MPLSFPTGSTVGELYKEGTKSWTWNGSAWDRVDPSEAPTGDTPPSVAVVGNTWFNTTNGKMYYFDDSEMWIQVSGTPLTADQRPDFSADGHSATATEAMLHGGTNQNGNNDRDSVDKFNFAGSDATSHGTLANNLKMHGSASSGTSVFAVSGSNGVAILGNVQKIDFATNTTAAAHGALSTFTHNQTTTQDAVQLMNAGGIYTGTRTTFVEKMAFATGSSAVPHGDLTSARSVSSAGSDGYQALQVGGNAGPGNGGRLNKIEKLNFGYNAVSVEVDQLVAEKSNQFAASDSVDLMTGCGVDVSAILLQTRQKISFATGAENTSFADAILAMQDRKACSDGTEAFIAGGTQASGLYNRAWKYNFSSMAQTANFAATGWGGVDPLNRTTHAQSSGGA